MKSNQPIGIFDSGIGGLTVAKALKQELPDESIIYIGDTAHLPYGDKSTAAVQAYAVRITDYLMKRRCKIILIACNSASAAAYDLVVEFVGKRALVFDVINPTVGYIRENFQNEKIGLIGTKQTVDSNVYHHKIDRLRQGIELRSLATPLLVPMIEEGIFSDTISSDIIQRYLDEPHLTGIKSLILGCTHYPIIKDQINDFYTNRSNIIDVIDSAQTVASALKSYLEANQLVAKSRTEEDQFFVTDYTLSFENTTKLFFGQKVHLQHLQIWDEFN